MLNPQDAYQSAYRSKSQTVCHSGLLWRFIRSVSSLYRVCWHSLLKWIWSLQLFCMMSGVALASFWISSCQRVKTLSNINQNLHNLAFSWCQSPVSPNSQLSITVFECFVCCPGNEGKNKIPQQVCHHKWVWPHFPQMWNSDNRFTSDILHYAFLNEGIQQDFFFLPIICTWLGFMPAKREREECWHYMNHIPSYVCGWPYCLWLKVLLLLAGLIRRSRLILLQRKLHWR